MKLAIFLLVLCIGITYGAKILSIFPIESYSHYILGLNLMTEMAKRGHAVTFVSPYNLKKPIKNIKEIELENYENLVDGHFKKFLDIRNTVFDDDTIMLNYKIMKAQRFFQHPDVKLILNSNETFDVVFFDEFASHVYLALGYHFKCPVILFVTHALPTYVNHLFGNPNLLSYVPTVGSTLTTDMSIIERIKNLWYYMAYQYLNLGYSIPKQNEIIQEELGPIPHLKELMYTISLVLVLSDVSYGQPYPVTAAMKEIGGFHIENTKKLPCHIQELLDNAKKGAIFFSMGSLIKSSLMTETKRNGILETFLNLTQTVLWKYEIDLTNKPENLKIFKWLPQQDILAHQNIKLFISHCGLLSIIEAVYHGIPMICLPVYYDQYQNAEQAMKLGYAEVIPFSKFTTEKLSLAIKTVISNPSYKENVLKRSNILRDKPFSQKDYAIFWLEYVIRNKGALALRSAALNLSWCKLYMFDLIAVLILTIIIVVFLNIKIYLIVKKYFIKTNKNIK